MSIAAREASVFEGVIQRFEPAQSTMRDTGAAPASLSSQAFDELFLSTYPRLVGILRRMLGDSGRAEEIASEAFLKLHNTKLPPAAKANVAGWLYRTAMNLGIDDLRARSRHFRITQQATNSSEATSTNHAGDGLQLLLRSERQQRVRFVLAKLKPDWAQLLLLRASGYSYKELAQHLGLVPASVGTMLIRAEAAFEKMYLELFGSKD
jgi:RNA polymerase sigma-70 factor (ECF subfamily)